MKKLLSITLFGMAVGFAFPGDVKGQSLKDSYQKQDSKEKSHQEWCNMAARKGQYAHPSWKKSMLYVHTDKSVTYTSNLWGKGFSCKKEGYVGRSWNAPYSGDCKFRRYGKLTQRFKVWEWDITDAGLTSYSKYRERDCQTNTILEVPGEEVKTITYPLKQGFSPYIVTD